MSADDGPQWIELPRPARTVATTHAEHPRQSRKRKLSMTSEESSEGASVDGTGLELHLSLPQVASAPIRQPAVADNDSDDDAAVVGRPSASDTADIPADVLGQTMRKVPGRYYSVSKASTARCYRCKQVGHYAMFCTNAPKSNACWICGEQDHDARDCDSDACFVCDETGHRWGACPNRSAMEEAVVRQGKVPGYGRHLVTQLGPEEAALRLMPRRAMFDGRGRAFQAERGSMPAAAVLAEHYCALCAGDSHTTTACPHAAKDLALTQCTSCGGRGHAFCVAGLKSTVGTIIGDVDLSVAPRELGACFNCGSSAHDGTVCPKPRAHTLFDGSIGPQPAQEPQDYRGGPGPNKRHRSGQQQHSSYYDDDDRYAGRHGYDSSDGQEDEYYDDHSESGSDMDTSPEGDAGRGRQGHGTAKGAAPAGGFAGACFKCGKPGHRAAECAQVIPAGQTHASQAPTGHGGGKAATRWADAKGTGPSPFQSTFKPQQHTAASKPSAAPAKAPAPAPAPAAASSGSRSSEPDGDGEDREPWWQRDPMAAAERRRILASTGASDADKRLQLQKLRKMVKKQEKRAEKGLIKQERIDR